MRVAVAGEAGIGKTSGMRTAPSTFGVSELGGGRGPVGADQHAGGGLGHLDQLE
jgi:hypothetical protein